MNQVLDAKALLDGGRWEFAYYAAGDAIECALKSCLLARMIYTGWVFQDKVRAQDCLTHDFGELVKLPGLNGELAAKPAASAAADGAFVINWGVVIQWQVTSRYEAKTEAEARSLYAAITDDPEGAAMDTELLVDSRIAEGERLLTELARSGFEVVVAFWVGTSDGGPWRLYIASPSVDVEKIGNAYLEVYNCLSRVPDTPITLSAIKLITPTNPIAVDAIRVRDHHPGKFPKRLIAGLFGASHFDEAYIYPPLKAVEVLAKGKEEVLRYLEGEARSRVGQPSEYVLARDETGGLVRVIAGHSFVGTGMVRLGGQRLVVIDGIVVATQDN